MKNKDSVRISVRLSEEEKEKLERSAEICGLSQSEFVRQLCKGKTPKPQPTKEFWELLEALYEVHKGFKECAKYEPSALDVCKEIECLTKTEAAIAVVDSNLHRERILPSEKAFAYKMKMEALKEQGKRTDLTSSQVATKSDTATEIGKATNESRDQVFRYIRLTNLIPELLRLVDEERIALTPAVELSYLTEQEQYDLMSIIESEDCTPSLSQAVRLKKSSQAGQLNADKIFAVMSEEKANQKERISFPFEDVRRFFPKSYTQKDVYNAILKLIGEDYQRRERARKNRDER